MVESVIFVLKRICFICALCVSKVSCGPSSLALTSTRYRHQDIKPDDVIRYIHIDLRGHAAIQGGTPHDIWKKLDLDPQLIGILHRTHPQNFAAEDGLMMCPSTFRRNKDIYIKFSSLRIVIAGKNTYIFHADMSDPIASRIQQNLRNPPRSQDDTMAMSVQSAVFHALQHTVCDQLRAELAVICRDRRQLSSETEAAVAALARRKPPFVPFMVTTPDGIGSNSTRSSYDTGSCSNSLAQHATERTVRSEERLLRFITSTHIVIKALEEFIAAMLHSDIGCSSSQVNHHSAATATTSDNHLPFIFGTMSTPSLTTQLGAQAKGGNKWKRKGQRRSLLKVKPTSGPLKQRAQIPSTKNQRTVTNTANTIKSPSAASSSDQLISWVLRMSNFVNEVQDISYSAAEELKIMNVEREQVIIKAEVNKIKKSRFDSLLSVTSLVVNAGALITGLFGMNLLNHGEKHSSMFYVVTCAIVVEMYLVYALLMKLGGRTAIY